MNFDEYQLKAMDTARYPTDDGIPYTALGLAGEAGEVANKVKKILRGDYKLPLPDPVVADLESELGDVLWYLAELASNLGLTLSGVAEKNIAKLADRAKRGVVKGTGDDR